jgi:1-acyl-sn-glycerol-3-phosphate acyltransferase
MHSFVLQIIYSFFLRLFLKVFVGVKFNNTESFNTSEQFVIVANHNSHLDTMAILASLPRKIIHKVKPVAAADHFGKTKLREALTNYFVNTLLIQRKRDRENPKNDPINKMIQSLDDGFSLLIFPEGTRGNAEIEQEYKAGVALVLSQRPNIKFIPVYLKGMGKSMPKEDSLIIPFTSSINIGALTKTESSDVATILEQIKVKITQLKNSS